eukprot:6633990-Heterocapsa_arctica.AAC.1
MGNSTDTMYRYTPSHSELVKHRILRRVLLIVTYDASCHGATITAGPSPSRCDSVKCEGAVFTNQIK